MISILDDSLHASPSQGTIAYDNRVKKLLRAKGIENLQHCTCDLLLHRNGLHTADDFGVVRPGKREQASILEHIYALHTEGHDKSSDKGFELHMEIEDIWACDSCLDQNLSEEPISVRMLGIRTAGSC